MDRYKKEFSIFENYKKDRGSSLVYLDSAATSQKPKAVVDAGSFFYNNYNANINRGVYYLEKKSTEIFEETRKKVADFINAKTENEIVFTRGTTDAINTIAQGIFNASVLHSNLLQDLCGCSCGEGGCDHENGCDCSCESNNSSCGDECNCGDNCGCEEKKSNDYIDESFSNGLAGKLDKINLDKYDLRRFSLFYKNAASGVSKQNAPSGINQNSSNPIDLLHNYAEHEITVSLAEHHSNLLPWRELSKNLGLKLNIFEVDDYGVIKTDKASLEKSITENTKVVAVTYISNVTGAITDLKPIVDRAHEVGAMVVVDACQAPAHIKVDVQKLDVDFLAFSAHKMYGPTGVGILYGKYDLLNTLPAVQTGGSMVNMVDLHEGVLYDDAPRRFEAGTMMVAQVAALGAAIDYLNSIGFDEINKHEIELLKKLYALGKIGGVTILGPTYENVFNKNGEWQQNKVGIISFEVDGIHPHDVSQYLDFRNIAIRVGHQCALPLHKRLGHMVSCRASLGVYNTGEDIEKFLSALKECISFFKKQQQK